METWKQVIGYEGVYEVSNTGKVKRILSYGNNKYRIDNEMSELDNRGYKAVILTKNNQSKRCLIHRLVAQAFIPNPENKPQVNHIDFNKANNRLDNLEWCSIRENVTHYHISSPNKRNRHIGVYFNKLNNNWRSEMLVNKKRINIGSFSCPAHANCARKLFEISII